MKTFSFGRYFAEINVLADLQFMPGEKPYIDRPSAPPDRKDLLLYLGCNVLRTAHLARTVIDVLKAMGFDFNTAGGPAHCCGIVHYQNNDPKGAHAFAANSMRHFAADCLHWAVKAKDPSQRQMIIDIARSWAGAAERIDRFVSDGRGGPLPDLKNKLN